MNSFSFVNSSVKPALNPASHQSQVMWRGPLGAAAKTRVPDKSKAFFWKIPVSWREAEGEHDDCVHQPPFPASTTIGSDECAKPEAYIPQAKAPWTNQ